MLTVRNKLTVDDSYIVAFTVVDAFLYLNVAFICRIYRLPQMFYNCTEIIETGSTCTYGYNV